jgi:tRNA pseudouridine-54 N-methylase
MLLSLKMDLLCRALAASSSRRPNTEMMALLWGGWGGMEELIVQSGAYTRPWDNHRGSKYSLHSLAEKLADDGQNSGCPPRSKKSVWTPS